MADLHWGVDCMLMSSALADGLYDVFYWTVLFCAGWSSSHVRCCESWQNGSWIGTLVDLGLICSLSTISMFVMLWQAVAVLICKRNRRMIPVFAYQVWLDPIIHFGLGSYTSNRSNRSNKGRLIGWTLHPSTAHGSKSHWVNTVFDVQYSIFLSGEHAQYLI